MPGRLRLGQLLTLMLTVPMVNCGGDRLPVSPSSIGTAVAGHASQTSGPSDYHEGEPGYPSPGDPYPTPSPAPSPTPTPTTPGTPVTISIVGTIGTAAFAPNPLQATTGSIVVWTNNDINIHRLVLDDLAGTLIGNMAPGESSLPITMTAATVSYHCALHPSMTGTIQDPAAAVPAPTPTPTPGEPSPTPQPPSSEPSPGYQPPTDYYTLPKGRP